MATTQYIGPRIIPVFAPDVEWDIDNTYDALTMVQHLGETFMSRQFVPVGIQLPDSSQDEEYNDYWVHMSNWNAQVESYRQEVLAYNGRISTLENDLPIAEFNDENTVKKAIDDVAELLPQTAFDSVNTVDARFDLIEADSWVTNDRIADNSIMPSKLNNVICPDNYAGTDTQKVQSAFDAIQNGGIVVLNRLYNVTADIEVKTNSDQHVYASVIGIGDKAGFSLDNCHFYGNGSPIGGLSFINVKFTGVNTTYAFNTDSIIRLYFDNCYFYNFTHVFYSPTTIMQTVYCSQCRFRAITNTVCYSNRELYDVRFNQCTVEASSNFMYVGGIQNNNITVRDCCIEGLTGYVFKYTGSLVNDLIFDGNYFEANAVYFDFSEANGTKEFRNVQITNNFAAFGNVSSDGFVKLPASGMAGSGISKSFFKVSGNANVDSTSVIPLFYTTNPTGNYESWVMGKNLFATPNRPGFMSIEPEPVKTTDYQVVRVYFDATGRYSTSAFVITGGLTPTLYSGFITDVGALDTSKLSINSQSQYTLNFQCNDNSYLTNLAGHVVTLNIGLT